MIWPRCTNTLKISVLLAGLCLGNAQSLCSAAESEGYYGQLDRQVPSYWPADRQPVTVYFEPAEVVPGYRPDMQDLVRKAIAEWQAALGEKVVFKYAEAASAASLVVAFTDDATKLRSQEEAGEAQMLHDNYGIITGRVLFLTTPPSWLSTLTDKYFYNLALHEIGHALGVTGHSASTSDIMYYSTQVEDKRAGLSIADKATINAIYRHPSLATANNGKLVMPSSVANVGVAGQVNDALKLMQQGRFVDAEQKMLAAQKAEPDNKAVANGLGALYASLANFALLTRNYPLAGQYFAKSLPMLEKSGNTAGVKQLLNAYVPYLQMTKQNEMATKMMQKMQALQ